MASNNSSKTAHVMNLLSKNRSAAEPAPEPAAESPAPQAEAAPAAPVAPIISSINADAAVSSQIKDALEAELSEAPKAPPARPAEPARQAAPVQAPVPRPAPPRPGRAGCIAAAAVTGWGGLSVHCQAMSLTAVQGLSFRWHWVGKAAQAALSALLAFLIFP